VICSGCGLDLPVGAVRGRPARFHGATCRQRARRARLATNNTELLAAVTAVDTVVSEVRRTVLAGEQSPADAGSRLQQTAAELAERLRGAGAAPALVSLSLLAAPDVTESVTEPAARPDDEPVFETADQPPWQAAPARRPRRGGGTARSRPAKPVALDTDTVRLERRGEDRPGWRVLGGSVDEPVVLGFVEPIYSLATGRRSRGWRAVNRHLIALPGKPCRNRTDALVRLVDYHQRRPRA
jgi:hypothetical protein